RFRRGDARPGFIAPAGGRARLTSSRSSATPARSGLIPRTDPADFFAARGARNPGAVAGMAKGKSSRTPAKPPAPDPRNPAAATGSVMLALAIAANAINRAKTRRLTRDFRVAVGSERLALDTLSALDVMISACLPTGDRTRFNEAFLKFVGKTAAQMQGHGW